MNVLIIKLLNPSNDDGEICCLSSGKKKFVNKNDIANKAFRNRTSIFRLSKKEQVIMNNDPARTIPTIIVLKGFLAPENNVKLIIVSVNFQIGKKKSKKHREKESVFSLETKSV
jgi:hypothetical protein